MTRNALLIALSSLILDHATKFWVTSSMVYGERIPVWSFFDLVRWHNEGAAFSMLASAGGWQRWVFITLGVGFSVYIVYELRKLPANQKSMVWVYGLILGGALGNLVDRIVQGFVVDFFLFHYGEWYFPAFNVADSSLFCGAVLWIGLMIQEYRQDAKPKAAAGGEVSGDAGQGRVEAGKR